MELLPNEEQKLNFLGTTITNKRVYTNSNKYKISIFLKNVSSVELHYKSKSQFLILSVLLGILGLSITSIPAFTLIGVLFGLALWWFSRKRTIEVFSNGGSSIKIHAGNSKESDVENFINSLQEEIDKNCTQ